MILRDRDLCDLYVQDSLERQSSHGNLRALGHSLELLLRRPITDSLIPDTCLIGPVPPYHTRVALRPGHIVLVDERTDAVRPVLPRDFRAEQVLSVSSTVDRGSVGSSLLHFGVSQNYCWFIHFGFFHDLWNSIRNAAKSVCRGVLWKYILKFLTIANMNHGPFRSGAWGKAKQSALKQWCATYGPDSPELLQLAPLLGESYGMPSYSRDDRLALYRIMGKLPSCTGDGPLLKLARWFSIDEVWRFFPPELWGLKVVLPFMKDSDSGAFDAIVS